MLNLILLILLSGESQVSGELISSADTFDHTFENILKNAVSEKKR